MNKKFGLLLLSCALLSSCSSFEQAPIVDNEFKDTTDANNDGIGAIGDGKKLRQDALLDDPTPITFVQPKLGYQYKIDGGNISVRYVAAISSTNVEAVWTRTIFTNTGAVYKAAQEKVSTKYYTAVINPNNDNNTEKAEDIVVDDGHPYVGFVVYTLLNVPLATYKDYHLSVSLTLTDINFAENTITSQVGNVYFGRYTGVKMVGNFGGSEYAYDAGVDSDALSDGKKYQKTNITLNAGDEFVFRDYDAAIDYGFDKLQTGAIPMFDEGTLENSIKVIKSGTYSFTLNNNNQLTVGSDLGYYILGEFGDDSSRYWKVDTGKKADGGNAEFSNVYLVKGKYYRVYNLSNSTAYRSDNTEGDARFEPAIFHPQDNFLCELSDHYNVRANGTKLYFDAVMNEGVNNVLLKRHSSWTARALEKQCLNTAKCYLEYRRVENDVEKEKGYCELVNIIGTDHFYASLDYSVFNRMRATYYSNSGRVLLIAQTPEIEIDPAKNYLETFGLEGNNCNYKYY